MKEYRGIKYSYTYNAEGHRYDILFQVNENSYKISYASGLSNKVESLIDVLCREAINFVKWCESINEKEK